MEIREGSFDFPSISGTGPQTAAEDPVLRFPREVLRAAAGITGYSAIFDRSTGDHHLGRLQVELNAVINPSDNHEVLINATFGLRDWSNNWDDKYWGNIQYAVIADLVPVTPPGPGESRGDLIITDAEINQAIQHFRSYKHLDAINVFPDNSIRLIADKPTGVRLYVDYDSHSGLPPIAMLSGELEVVSGAMSTTLVPLANIVPRRDIQIDRGQTGHTLNFTIPEGLCTGNVTIRATVFSAADRSQFSETFERSLQFFNSSPVRVFCVGIDYTGPDIMSGATPAQLQAPPQSAFTNLFQFTELIYPIPSVTQTGYMTATYDKEVKSDITKGCDKVGDLRDWIKDLRGDSSDIFYGLLNTGVDTGSVGGCGGSGNAAVGIVGATTTVAHELGHVLGRKHAPCDNVTRCARPLDTDDDYPHYSGYDSDSIGEFGFDTTTGLVRGPVTSHDMMGYSGGKWISPYTYKALLSRVPGSDGGSGGSAEASLSSGSGMSMAAISQPSGFRRQDEEWIRMKQDHLFMSLKINMDRSVEWRPAFHYPVYPQAHDDTKTDFVIEFRDGDGNILNRECLYLSGNSCGCGCDEGGSDWPKEIRQAVPYHPGAKKVIIYECEKSIFEQDIPEPPTVKMDRQESKKPDEDSVTFHWSAMDKNEAKDLWYLLQWRDAYGVWRGCAPRTQDSQLSIPKTRFQGVRMLAIRLLATSGIATGMATWEGEIEYPKPEYPGDRDVQISIPGVGLESPATYEVNPVIRVSVLDRYGRSVENPEILWYGGAGSQIGRGRSFDLRQLPIGFQQLRAVVLNTGQEGGSTRWMVEHSRDNHFRIHRGTITYPDPNCPPEDQNPTGGF